jgi:hypothetical protein
VKTPDGRRRRHGTRWAGHDLALGKLGWGKTGEKERWAEAIDENGQRKKRGPQPLYRIVNFFLKPFFKGNPNELNSSLNFE